MSWYEDDPNQNENQTTELIDFKTIHIKIEQYIEKYDLEQLFDFDYGTKFKDEYGNVYELMEDADGKYISGLIAHEKLVRSKYTKAS